jgi:C-terminal processing protease CtpA/Prc
MSPSTKLRYGTIGDRLGYLWVPTFSGSGWDVEIDDALARLGEPDALIIDIRNNGGGNNDVARRIAGRFADRERIVAYSRFRNGPGHSDLTGYYPTSVSPLGARRFNRPVYVLTSRRNFSSAEDFVLAMRAQPMVTVVGDSTGGGAGYPMVRELPNGWFFRLSEGVAYTAEREEFEETGLVPDVFVRQAPGVTASDQVLERACELAGVPRCRRQ